MMADGHVPFAGELLAEAAESFFGTRRRIERMTLMLEDAAGRLRQLAENVRLAAARLNRLLIHPQQVNAFYAMLGVDPVPFSGGRATPGASLGPLPRCLTVKGQYRHLVSEAYESLQRRCRKYMTGEAASSKETDAQPYYGLLKEMASLINARIAEANCAQSPTCTLQSVRQFYHNGRQFDGVASPDSGQYASRLQTKLNLQPIDFESLHLQQFPLLPESSLVTRSMIRFCNATYVSHKREIQALLAELK